MRPSRLLGCLAILAGVAVLGWLARAIYDPAASHWLVDIGIPGAMIAGFVGLALIFAGAAVALSRAGPGKAS